MQNLFSAGHGVPALRRALLIGGALFLPATPALAQDAAVLPPVVVDSNTLSENGAVVIDRASLTRTHGAASDTAATLESLPGVSAYNAGGVSSLPVVRGLDNQRLSILVDGVRIDDVCPNNMNPPLSYTDPQTVESISVLTGVTPVSMGGDTIGGAIAVETVRPRFATGEALLVTGRVSGFYRSNGDAFGGSATATLANRLFSLTYAGSYTQSGNDTGGGDDGTVRSTEYAKTDHSLTLAAQTDLGLFELRGGIQRVPYEGFPNQYMDMVDNRSWFLNGRYRGAFAWGDIDLAVHYRDTDHVMNFLDDKGGSAGGGMPMNTEGHTAGYTLGFSLPLSDAQTLRLGSALHHQWLNDWWPPVAGSMMMGPDVFVNINRAHRDRLGHYVELESRLSDRVTTVLGLRNDQVWMNTGDVQPYGTNMMQMGDVAAANAFNAADHNHHDSNWSGSAIVRVDATDNLRLELGYAHKVRSPNLYELYAWGRGSMASRMIGWFGDGNGYVGNIALDPERADTISASATFTGGNAVPWTLRIAPWFTHVSDYIDVVKIADLTDMMGMPTGFVQLQFANAEARLYGIDISGQATLWQGTSGGSLVFDAAASWSRGDNLDDDGALYHQMPFNARAALRYANRGWDANVEVQGVADKTRVDATHNETETDGYVLVNLGMGYGWNGFRIGVEATNLLDRAYALPLGGMSIGDYDATGVLRPVPGRGRSVNVQFSAAF